MSGSRTAAHNSDQRELMFCHQCQNEWYQQDANGLRCPRCASDFTEVIDPSFDPRADPIDEIPLRNPWAEDPGEDDIDNFGNGPERSFGREGFGVRHQESSPPSGFTQNAFGRSGLPESITFANVFQNILGAGLSSHNEPSTGASFQRHLNDGASQTSALHQMTDGRRMNVWTTTGPGFSFTAQTSSRAFPGGEMRINHQEVNSQDIGMILEGIFRNMGIPGAMNAPRAGGPPPFAALFNSMLNPGNAVHGDTVFTQEAFDRVMSQLMEEHASGNAPGPASESAIRALPRKRVTDSMLDEMTKKAECSICMDDVTVDEEVTTLPCGHWFHFPCVEAWLKEHDTCPVCRAGIMPRDGNRDTVRSPSQMPLNDEDPFLLARQQSGTREHPYVVPESPTLNRRRSNPRRHSSSDAAASSSSRRSSQREEDRSSITGRVRSFFGGNSGGANKRA